MKRTAEDMLAQKINKRESFRLKRDNSLRMVEEFKAHAKNAETEYELRDRQVKAMEDRIEEGRVARAEADELRGPFQALKDTTTPEAQETLERIKALDAIYHGTQSAVASIYNGSAN